MDFQYIFVGGISFSTELHYGSVTLNRPQSGSNVLSYNGTGYWASPDRVFFPGKNTGCSSVCMINPYHQLHFVSRKLSPPFTDVLKVTHFDLSPIDGFINKRLMLVTGCKVQAQCWGIRPFSRNVNLAAHIVKNNVIHDAGIMKYNIPYKLQYNSFGDSNEQWGVSWHLGDVNSGLGAAFYAEYGDSTKGSKFFSISHVQIVLYFYALTATYALITHSNWSYSFSGGLSLDSDTVMGLKNRHYTGDSSVGLMIHAATTAPYFI